MFYDYVTRPGSDLRVGVHAKGPPSDPDMYAKHENKVWIESDHFLTRMATLFLSGNEKKAIADAARRDGESVAEAYRS